ncbi:unnamed protein product [Sphagnum jensenii]|uniref:Uncharacterized protein n=1 Tax=Sphagnum jensenii TaxID=128206 RepID=A0ABP0VTW1_9BRYO
MEWYGIRRKDRELVQHQTCCFGINHSKRFSDHHLYIVDVVSEGEQLLEPVLRTGEDTGENATMQRLLETEGHGAPSESSDEKEECETGSGNSDIWEYSSCMELLQTRVLPVTVDPLESKRVRKRVLNYHWQGQALYFRNRLVRKPEDRLGLVVQIHNDLGHSREERTLAESSMRFSPFMILTGRTPRLRADNYLQALTAETDDTTDVDTTAEQFIQKVFSGLIRVKVSSCSGEGQET